MDYCFKGHSVFEGLTKGLSTLTERPLYPHLVCDLIAQN